MKYTPDTLLQIYLDGSFTEDAQVEFDRLMREDPLFAEGVVRAVEQRLGSVPADAMARMEARLDEGIQDVWDSHKPSPWGKALQWGAKGLLALAVAGGVFWGLSEWRPGWLPARWGGAATGPDGVEGKVDLVLREKAVDERIPGAQAAPGSRPEAKRAVPPPAEEVEVMIPIPPPGGARVPKVITPSGPPSTSSWIQEGDSARIEIELDATQEVLVTILDPSGRLVRTLYRGTMTAGTPFVDWDGRDDTGLPVPPGDYTVVFEAGGKRLSDVLSIRAYH